MVVIKRDNAGTPTVWCDPEIVDLVTALNAGGLPTIASCSGHGETMGRITLKDGRELLITDYDTATAIGLNHRPPASSERVALSDARIYDIAEDFKSQHMFGGETYDEFDHYEFARAIEAAHGIPAPARGGVLASGQIKEPASGILPVKESDHE